MAKTICRPCKKYAGHGTPDVNPNKKEYCIQGGCECWCNCEDHDWVPPRPPRQTRADLTHVLQVLYDHGVTSRVTRSYELLFKPKPRDLPGHVEMLIKQHYADLSLVLMVWDSHTLDHRPYWTTGPLRGCLGCGASTARVDPLRQPRHSWCGWLNQEPVVYERGMSSVTGYPKIGSDGSHRFD